MPGSVLVVGSTGTQGGAVATRLLDEGIDVHALTRNPDSEAATILAEHGATVVKGDLDDRPSLEAAVAAVDAAFCVTNYFEHGGEAEIRQGKTFADTAAAANLDHLVFSSVASADADTSIRPFETKAEIERYLATLGVPTTVVRPTYFMQNFEAMRDRIADGTLAMALEPRIPLQLVDVADIGAIVATALQNQDEYAGEIVELAGDELTPNAMAIRLGAAMNRDVATVSIPNEKLRESLGDDYADMFSWFNESGFEVDLAALRADHEMSFSTFDDYLRENGWEN